ncbi:MAG: protein-disulfide reductase DsbD family protein, partial [Erythrobacter sp.]|nr:protein-disulfide reductase DsbD family protein [Erythrobacter sp.]
MSRARTFPLSVRQFAAWTLALIASVMVAGAAQGLTTQPPPTEARYGDQNIAVTLFADGAPEAGKEWMLALRFTPSAHEWHGYWSNPGDAGQGMKLWLNLPEGWRVGEARYPVPQRLTISGLMNHIYEGTYAVLVPVIVPPGADVGALPRITGHVEYLACTDKICVPQDALLDARQGGDFARWRAQVTPPLSAGADFAITRSALRLAIPLPASVTLNDPHVFISNANLVDYAAPQTFRRAGDVLTVDIPLADYRPDTPSAVGGILAFNAGAGVEFGAIPGDVPSGGDLVAGPQGALIPPLWTLVLGALAGGLLLNIMPRTVYEEFKAFGVVTPQLYPSVSVLMLDFVGFTAFAARTD